MNYLVVEPRHGGVYALTASSNAEAETKMYRVLGYNVGAHNIAVANAEQAHDLYRTEFRLAEDSGMPVTIAEGIVTL